MKANRMRLQPTLLVSPILIYRMYDIVASNVWYGTTKFLAVFDPSALSLFPARNADAHPWNHDFRLPITADH